MSKMKKFKERSTIDRNISKKDPLADYKAEQRRKKKLKEQGSFNVGGVGNTTGRGLGRQGLPSVPKDKPSLREQIRKERFKKEREKIYNKPKTPLKGKMKKPKPGSYDYFLEQTLRPAYKGTKGMNKGGDPFKGKETLSRIERIRKAKGFKPGETPSQFNKRKAMEEFAKRGARATTIGKVVAPIALAGVSAIQYLKSKMKKNKEKAKAEKKMGGGLTEATKRLKAQGMLSGGQMKIAAKAPPRNKIDAKDFAVLRAEKAKGRGKGLQDEKMKPGKTMKAALGAIAIGKAVKGSIGKSDAKKIKSAGAMGAIGVNEAKAKAIKRITGIKKGALIKPKNPGFRPKPTDRYGQPFKPKPIKPDKKMGGGMMMQRPMGYEQGDLIQGQRRKFRRTSPTKAGRVPIQKETMADRSRMKMRRGMMGGGMMMRPNPVGMKSGKSVKVKCKLGRNKPTKMY
tara:strand:+ start:76 stop:1437 length:1362 start_codon:yes stop_codon:yes gene_type:complete